MKPRRWCVFLIAISALAAPVPSSAQSALAQPDPSSSATPAAAPALTAAPATAPPPADTERAKQSFKAGAAAYAAGDYAAAIQALESAYALSPLPAIAFSLAQAERRQYFVTHEPGHLTRSIELFRLYIGQVQSGGRRSDAVDALAQLEPIAAKIDANVRGTPPASGERHTRLIIFSEVPGAQIAVDGGDRSGSPLLLDVEPGQHRVEVRATGFATAEREVTAVQGELIPVSVPLAPLPSRVELSTPARADVYVNGIFASEGGEQLVLELPSGIHRLSVVENGYRVDTRVLELGKGELLRESVTLEPTAQRHASYALLLAGGGAVLAGGAFSYLAVSAQDSAQEFLAKRERENVSQGERVRYEAAITQRDRYRTIAGASFGAALGLFVTGLLLHELDEPEPEDLRAPAPTLQPREPAADRGRFGSNLAWSGLVAPGELGLTLRGEF